MQTHPNTWDQTTQTSLNVLDYDGKFQSLWYNSLCQKQTVQLLSCLPWCIWVMHHYLAVFSCQQDNLTGIMISLKNSTEGCNSYFTVILFLLDYVPIFSWAMKKSLFLTNKTCTKFPVWYLPLVTNFNIAYFNSVILLVYQASVTCPVIQDQHYLF